MKSRQGTISDDRQRRPALATGLPTHRAPVRQASPRRGEALWSRRSFQLAGLVLTVIVVGVLLYVSGATKDDVARPVAATTPVVVESAPDSDASVTILSESAVVAPVELPDPVTTSVPLATAPPAVLPTAVAPTATRTLVPATATPVPEATNTSAAASSEVWVGKTGGSGVYVRATPSVADRLRAYGDGTQLTIIGEDVTGDGQQWKHIRTPDGLEGYVPAVYVIQTAP